jgi:hypothetical protein
VAPGCHLASETNKKIVQQMPWPETDQILKSLILVIVALLAGYFTKQLLAHQLGFPPTIACHSSSSILLLHKNKKRLEIGW